MGVVQSVTSSWASIVGAQDIVNSIEFESPDITPSVVAVAVNVYVPGVISAGAFNSIDQTPFTMVSSVPTWVAPANRVIESIPSGAVPVIVMGVVQSVTSSWASIVGAQDIVNSIEFESPDITPSVVAVAVNVYVPGVISAGAFNSIDQTPFTMVSSVPTWVAPANRVIESVPSGAVPVIVMGVVQSVTSSWASIVGAQDIVNSIEFESPDITPSVVAVAVNVYVPGVISAGAFNSIDQTPFTMVSSVPTWVAPANRVIESVPSGAVPVIVMGVVQSVTSSWASIVGAQDIVNSIEFDLQILHHLLWPWQ